MVTAVPFHSAGSIRKLDQLLGDCHHGERERILKIEMTLFRIMMSFYMKAGMEKLSWRVKQQERMELRMQFCTFLCFCLKSHRKD